MKKLSTEPVKKVSAKIKKSAEKKVAVATVKTPLREEELENAHIATNGKAYEITGENKVRKVNAQNLGEFVRNLTDSPMDESIEKENTKILYKYLKNEFTGVEFKRGYVYYKNYRMGYNSHGFVITDKRNFNSAINLNKYHNDYPTPEDVRAFLTTADSTPVQPAPKNTRGDVERGIAAKEVPVKTEPTIGQVKQRLTSLFKKRMAKKISLVEFKKELYKKIPKKIFWKCRWAFVKYEKKEIRLAQLKEDIYAIVQCMNDEKPPAPPKPAPRFEGLELEEPISIVREGEEILYELTGPGKKRYSRKCHVGEFLARQVLHHFPKAMPMIMKVCKGEKFNFISTPAVLMSFVQDKFEAYEMKLISQCEDKLYLAEICQEILWDHSITTALDYQFGTYKKNTKMQIWLPESHTWYDAVVIDTEKGVRIRFADGEVTMLKTENKVRRVV